MTKRFEPGQPDLTVQGDMNRCVMQVQLTTYSHGLDTLLEKVKGSIVFDCDRKKIFCSEQENANYFLLRNSFILNALKFQNRQNNAFFTKDV